MSPAAPRLSGTGAPQVSASPGVRLPSRAVTPGHSNHAGPFILLAPASPQFRPRPDFHPKLELLPQELRASCQHQASGSRGQEAERPLLWNPGQPMGGHSQGLTEAGQGAIRAWHPRPGDPPAPVPDEFTASWERVNLQVPTICDPLDPQAHPCPERQLRGASC